MVVDPFAASMLIVVVEMYHMGKQSLVVNLGRAEADHFVNSKIATCKDASGTLAAAASVSAGIAAASESSAAAAVAAFDRIPNRSLSYRNG